MPEYINRVTYINIRNTDERKAMCYLFQMRLRE